MENEIAISDLVTMDFDEAFNKGNCYGFFDWFCKDSSLPNKAKVLFAKLKSLVRSGKFDPTKCYVFFKNNCPCSGGLYDDLRICDIESGDVLFNVCPSDPWYGYMPRVAFESNDGVDRWSNPLVFETMKDLKAWFKDPSRFETVKTDVYGNGRLPRRVTVSLCRAKAEAKAA